MQPNPSAPQNESVDVTAVMVFTVAAFGLGGYPLLSLLRILGL